MSVSSIQRPLNSDGKPLPTELEAAKYNWQTARTYCKRIHDGINGSRAGRGQEKLPFIFPKFEEMYPEVE